MGATEPVIGMALMVTSLSRMLTLIPAGIIADRWRRDRLMLGVAMYGLVGSFIVLSQVHLLWQFFVVMPVFGLCSGMVMGVLLARIGQSVEAGSLGRSVSYYTASLSLGLAVGALGGGPLIDWLGFQLAYWNVAILLALGSLVLIGLRRKEISVPHPILIEPVVAHESLTPIKKTPRGFYFLLIGYVIHYLGFGSFFVFFALYMVSLGGTATMAGIADGIQLVVGLVLIPLMGIIADRRSPRTIILIAFWGDLLLLVLLWINPSIWWVFPMMILSGVNAAGSMTGELAMTATLVKTHRGRALNTATTMSHVAFTLAPLVGGVLLGMGGFALLFPISIGLTGIAAIWAVLLIKAENQGITLD